MINIVIKQTCMDAAGSDSASSMASSVYMSSSQTAACGRRRGSEKLSPATEVMSLYSLSDRDAFMDGMSMPTCNQGKTAHTRRQPQAQCNLEKVTSAVYLSCYECRDAASLTQGGRQNAILRWEG